MATIPIIISALQLQQEVPPRDASDGAGLTSTTATQDLKQLLDILHDLWRNTRFHTSPWLTDPPGGLEDVPTPVLDDIEDANEQKATLEELISEEQDGDSNTFDYHEPDTATPPRSKKLCAWQIAKAIERGIPVYQRILYGDDVDLAAAAAKLLSIWPWHRAEAQARIVEIINNLDDVSFQRQMSMKNVPRTSYMSYRRLSGMRHLESISHSAS